MVISTIFSSVLRYSEVLPSVSSLSAPVGLVSTTNCSNACAFKTHLLEALCKVHMDRVTVLKSKPPKLPDSCESAHLLLNRVVLPDIGLDLLHNWPVLNLGECLGITDGSLTSRGGGCLQSAPKLVSLMQGTGQAKSPTLQCPMMLLMRLKSTT